MSDKVQVPSDNSGTPSHAGVLATPKVTPDTVRG